MTTRAAAGPGPEETVVWEGRSQRGLTFNAFDGPLMETGAFLVILAIALLVNERFLSGVPLLVFGSYLAIGQLLIEARGRARTRYVLTTDHAYLLHSWPQERTVAIDLRRDGPAVLTHHRDRTGTITFGRAQPLVAWIGPIRWARPAFRYIADAPRLMPVIRGEADELEPIEPPDPVDGPDPIEAGDPIDAGDPLDS